MITRSSPQHDRMVLVRKVTLDWPSIVQSSARSIRARYFSECPTDVPVLRDEYDV